MKQLPLISKEDAEPKARILWESMPDFDLAIFHVTAHAPDAMEGWMRFGGTIWREEDGGFPLLQKEMAEVWTSVLANSSYEWGNHGAGMLRRGGTQDQLDALIARQPDADVFDDMEKLVLQFTTEVTIDARPSEESIMALAQVYTPRQITELVFGICGYMMNSRLANLGACEIGDDEDYGMFRLGRKT